MISRSSISKAVLCLFLPLLFTTHGQHVRGGRDLQTEDDGVPTTLLVVEEEDDPPTPTVGSISGFALEDTDGDEEGDTPMEGVTMVLMASTSDIFIAETETDGSGFYSFEGLQPTSSTGAVYTVVEATPSDFVVVSAGQILDIEVGDGEAVTGQDFVNKKQLHLISGSVLEDSDNDGSGDNPLSNVMVILMTKTEGQQVAATLTDSDGNFEFHVCPTGDKLYLLKTMAVMNYPVVDDSDGTASGTSINEILVDMGDGGDSTGNMFILEAASLSPSASPTSSCPVGPPEPSDERCDPVEDSFVWFSGHDQAISWKLGVVNVTWSPAFVYHMSTEELIWCRDYIYDVFIGRAINGKDNIYEDLEYDELLNGDDWDHFETTDTNIQLENNVPGEEYQILVLARTIHGHVSYNRRPAVVEVSGTDPIWQDGYKGWANLPHTTDQFQVETRQEVDGRHVVKFEGIIPQEVRDIVANYHIYFFTSDGGSDFGRAKEKITDTINVIEWVFTPADLSDVFKEMEVSADVPDGRQEDDLDDGELDQAEEEELEAALARMSTSVRMHLCQHAYPGSPPCDCIADSIEDGEPNRMLMKYGDRMRRLGWFKKLRKKLRKKIKEIIKAVKKAAQKVVDAAKKLIPKLKFSIDKTLKFLDIEEGRKLTCFDEALQVGIGFDASARARVKIKVSLTFKVYAKVRFFGGIGAQAYVFLEASGEKTFKPAPVELFQTSFDVIIPVGPIPVLITHRPTVSAFIEASINSEAKGLVPLSVGWDYEFGFERKDGKTDTFRNIDRRPPPEEDPVFELRLSLEADAGITLEWQILFFKLIQASVAFDFGLNLEMEVGTNLEAIVITQPYFYILDQFNIDFFIRLRAAIGLNEDIGNSIGDKKGDNSDDSKKCKYYEAPYKIPSFQPEDPSLPDVFVTAIANAHASGKFDDGITLDDFLSDAGVKDAFTGKTGELTGPVDKYSASVVIYRNDTTLLSVPKLSIQQAGEAGICQGDNAIVLPLTTKVQTSGLMLEDILNGEWFLNLDGELFEENSPWVVSGGDLSDYESLVLELPRSALAGSAEYKIEDGASVFIRATAELMPWPRNALFAKGMLQELFPSVTSFECCEDSDCEELHICDANRECKREFATIGGTVVEDVDNDGVGEVPIPGSSIALIEEDGTVLGTTSTDSKGAFEFTVVVQDGGYIVVQENLPGYTDVDDTDGTTGGTSLSEIVVDVSQGDALSLSFIDLKPTPSPTLSPTRAPTKPPTRPPTASPTPSPLKSISGIVTEDIEDDGVGDVPILVSVVSVGPPKTLRSQSGRPWNRL